MVEWKSKCSKIIGDLKITPRLISRLFWERAGVHEMKGTYGHKRAVVAGLLLLAVPTADAVGIFTVSGREIFLDGSVFEVRGMCYQPTPVGEDVAAGPPYGDYYTDGYAELWARDFENLRRMNANVIRIYGWTIGADHNAFLDAAHNNGGQSLHLLVSKWINPATDWGSTGAVNALVSEWEAIATELKNHPAVMGFLIGNETNWQENNGDDPEFWVAMNLIAGAVKAVAPDKLVSVAITDALDQVQSRDASMTLLDFWAIQVYRGSGFGTFFSDYAVRSPKPLVITEFGYDAYDAVSGGEFAGDAALPADAMEYLWKELRYNHPVVSGGCVFEYTDEWWKSGSPFTHDAPPGWPAPFVDGEGNEEWWGVFRIVDNGTEPDLLQPRAMFYRLAAIWNEPFPLTFLQAGASDGKLEARFSYPAHLRDQQLQLEISPDLDGWTTVADNSASIYLEPFTPTVVLTSTETNQEVQVTLVHNPSATGPYTPANLLANGDFEYGSTFGWEIFATASSAVARDGTYSLQLDASGDYTAPLNFQTIPASPGEEFNLSGYMYTATPLPADATFGLFKIIFKDLIGDDLPPASVSIGQPAGDPAFPGGESLPMLDATSPVGSWVFSEVQTVAPSNTASVSFFVINIDQSANTMYFDSIEAVEVAEVPEISNTAFFRIINSGR